MAVAGVSVRDSRVANRVRFRAIVRGRVQGVSFRYYTLEMARELGVLGFVRNRWDGTVEIVAEGQEASARRLVTWLHTGPRWARVEDVDVTWEDPIGEFKQFEVRF